MKNEIIVCRFLYVSLITFLGKIPEMEFLGQMFVHSKTSTGSAKLPCRKVSSVTPRLALY